jgi:hypothetical protein
VDMDEEKHDDMEEVEKCHPLVLIMERWAMFLYFHQTAYSLWVLL